MKTVGSTGRPGTSHPPYRWGRAATTMGAALVLLFCALVALISAERQVPGKHSAWLGAGTHSFVADGVVKTPRRPQRDVREIEVQRGDTLSGLLVDEGTSIEDAQAVTNALSPVFDASDLRGGQNVTLVFLISGAPEDAPVLTSLSFKPSVERDIRVVRSEDGSYRAEETVKALKPVGARARGTIQGSLYQSASDAGVPDGVIVEMIRIYSHAVDFQREIRSGDSFDVLFTTYADESGEILKSGAIDFVQLTLSGQAKPLYRFSSSEDQTTDYYTPEGKSGKRLLMRTPVDGARLTSGFGMRRHPILGYSKMHKGVDFAAPTGTPIMAAGSGTIKFARWFGSYGKYVRIAHANKYETAYAHMSRFAPGIREGVRVRQGQVIGYVGTTGRSTGAHLPAFKAHVARVNSILDNLGQAPALVAQGEILRAKLLP